MKKEEERRGGGEEKKEENEIQNYQKILGPTKSSAAKIETNSKIILVCLFLNLLFDFFFH